MHWVQSNSVFHIKHESIIDFFDGTPESSQEHCHMSRGNVSSSQQHETSLCTTNHLEMRPDYPSLAPEQSRISHHTLQVA